MLRSFSLTLMPSQSFAPIPEITFIPLFVSSVPIFSTKMQASCTAGNMVYSSQYPQCLAECVTKKAKAY